MVYYVYLPIWNLELCSFLVRSGGSVMLMFRNGLMRSINNDDECWLLSSACLYVCSDRDS